MIQPITFFVEGTPKGQPRPKAFNRGAHAGVYDPGTANEWKAAVAIAARPYIPADKLACPLSVNLIIYFPRPKSHYRSNGELKPNRPVVMTKKPDADNVAKAIFDVLTNAGMWIDDDQICDCSIKKRYSDGPGGAMIEIKEALVL